ncbi:MAG: hypothetical protein ACRYFA_00755 [Janthinobacterium lividum]
MRFPDIQQTKEFLPIAGVIYLAGCFAVAWIWGRKRKVGFLFTFLFSALLTPFIGFLIAVSGKKAPEGRI